MTCTEQKPKGTTFKVQSFTLASPIYIDLIHQWYMYVPFQCQLFQGLSLALRSHDQFETPHWSTFPNFPAYPPPLKKLQSAGCFFNFWFLDFLNQFWKKVQKFLLFFFYEILFFLKVSQFTIKYWVGLILEWLYAFLLSLRWFSSTNIL